MKAISAILGSGVVTLSAVAGYLAYGSFHPEAAGESAITRSPAIEHVPDLTLPDPEGRLHQLSDWKGQPLMINFWATWCEPCQREIPLLEKIRAEHAEEGLEVLGIAVDFKEPVSNYVQEARITYPVLIAADNGMVARTFGVGMGLPTTVFARRDGRILTVKVGELHSQEATDLVRQLLKAP